MVMSHQSGAGLARSFDGPEISKVVHSRKFQCTDGIRHKVPKLPWDQTLRRLCVCNRVT